MKHSGTGRAHSQFGFHECVNLKHVSWEPGYVKQFWWHSTASRWIGALRNSAKLLYGRDADKPGRAAQGRRPARPGPEEDAAALSGRVS